MSRLSIYNMCISPLRSCLGASEVNEGAYVQNMTQNSRKYDRRCSSVGESERSEQSVGFWRSWEFLSNNPHLGLNKPDDLDRAVSEFSGVAHQSSTPSVCSQCDPDVPCKSLRLRTNRISSENNESKSRYNILPPSGVPWSEHSSDNLTTLKKGIKTRWNVSQESSREPSEVPSTSGYEIPSVTTSSNSVNNSNLGRSSKGAIPKCANISQPGQKRDEDVEDFSDEDDDGDLNARSVVSSPITTCNIQESKNMTSLLPYNNYSLGKDVLDNGTALLSSKLQVHTARDRLKTFKNWPNKRIEPKTLADAGFFYCGRADIVECYKCGIKGHNWVENDKPMEDHMRWNKDCPFVRENTSEHDNIQARQGQDICGNLGVEILPNSRPEDIVESETSLEKLGIQKAKGPSHPDQIIFETRLATFENWPKSMKQKPPELAAAGFYYLGIGDQTLCFYCGGGLKDWVEDDDPWEQHALWFPKCNFLLLKKTPAYVEAVHKKHKDLLSCKKEETEVEASCSSSNSDTKETPSCHSANNEEERKSDESTTLCKICFKNELGVVFLPCGHMVACIDCASALKECAVCRKGIQATVRAFLS